MIYHVRYCYANILPSLLFLPLLLFLFLLLLLLLPPPPLHYHLTVVGDNIINLVVVLKILNLNYWLAGTTITTFSTELLKIFTKLVPGLVTKHSLNHHWNFTELHFSEFWKMFSDKFSEGTRYYANYYNILLTYDIKNLNFVWD